MPIFNLKKRTKKKREVHGWEGGGHQSDIDYFILSTIIYELI